MMPTKKSVRRAAAKRNPAKRPGRFESPFRFLAGDDARGGFVRAEDLSTDQSRIVYRTDYFNAIVVARYLDNAPASVKRAVFSAPASSD